MDGSGDNDLDKKNKIIKNIYISIFIYEDCKEKTSQMVIKV